MRPALLLAPILALSACGARTDLFFGSDAGSSPPALHAGSPPPRGSTTETAITTGYGTGTYANSTTAVEVGANTGSAIGTSPSSASCMLSASNYDQSCTVDTDCTIVPLGDFCTAAGQIDCSESISVGAMGAYNAAVSKTPLAQEGLGFGCGVSTPPCCHQGLCTMDCLSASDTLPACSMAGGTCIYAPPTDDSASCSRIVASASAPVCAKADEVCCVREILR